MTANKAALEESITTLRDSLVAWQNSTSAGSTQLGNIAADIASRFPGDAQNANFSAQSQSSSAQLPFDADALINILDILKDALLEFVEVAKPASLTATGSPGNYNIDGTTAFYLCVKANTWVKLQQMP